MGQLWKGWGSPDKALGPQLYLESSLWTLMLESHPQIITFQVLGEQNCIFIKKNKVDPSSSLPLVIYFSENGFFCVCTDCQSVSV